MAEAAEAGRYAEVCKGTPWVNSTICNWAAAKAGGKGADRPNGELFRAYFGKEHWKHAYGRIIGDADSDGTTRSPPAVTTTTASSTPSTPSTTRRARSTCGSRSSRKRERWR